ncbi:MAG: hypothetical protein EBS84_02995 [Proteobacteria bacterium]|nr:hypothetical protein [Verrucomicrobiota bacterium]NBU07978.1 hypothetical protein [Pseudomonadota bacterium]
MLRLFGQLEERAEVFARMQDEFTEIIALHRAAREGRPVRLSARQQRMLTEFDRDAEQAVRDMERHTFSMDDAALLTSALSGVEQQIQLDEHMLPGFHADDQPMATQLLEYQRETMLLIEQFVASSPFRGRVTSIWHGKRITKPVA